MGTENLWNGIESLRPLQAVLVEWALEIGADYEAGRAFLQPTLEQAKDYPCTARFRCPCQHHHITMHSPERIVATCECGCRPITLEPKDVIVFALDVPKLGEAIRQAMALDPAPQRVNAKQSGAVRIGTRGAAQLPVYFHAPQDEAALVVGIEDLLSTVPGPFILLTPTGAHDSATVDGMQARHVFLLLALSRWLRLEGAGRLKLVEEMDAVWAAFDKRLSEGVGMAKTVERLDRNMEAVAKANYELRKENEDLRRLAADGYFKFVLSVDPLDFRYFAAIFALGDRAKAARELEVKERTFYDRVHSWAARGPEYKRMLAIVEARKRAISKVTVRLGTALQSGGVQNQPENPATLRAVLDQMKARNLDQRDYPQLLQDILNALLEMNPKNWQAIRDELVPIIREEVPQ